MGRSIHWCLEVQVSSYWLRIILCSMKDSHVHKLYRPFTWNASLYGERCMLFRNVVSQIALFILTRFYWYTPSPTRVPQSVSTGKHTMKSHLSGTCLHNIHISNVISHVPRDSTLLAVHVAKQAKNFEFHYKGFTFPIFAIFSQQSVICKYYAFSFSKLCTKLSSVNQLRLQALISSKK